MSLPPAREGSGTGGGDKQVGKTGTPISQIRELKQPPSGVPRTYGAGFTSPGISLSLPYELRTRAQVLKGGPPTVTPRGDHPCPTCRPSRGRSLLRGPALSSWGPGRGRGAGPQGAGGSRFAAQGRARRRREPRPASRPSPGTVRPVCLEPPRSPLAAARCALPTGPGARALRRPALGFPPLRDTSPAFGPTPRREPGRSGPRAAVGQGGGAERSRGAWRAARAGHGRRAPGRVRGSGRHEWERGERGARARPQRRGRLLL